ncbi:uncharacterized protein PAC_13495 [Phialocephala subalpina]|uniref:DUF300-domain-containing protein n=1 Tax=Phialocephala subalpina TaxID=576137 RepID=A0A1L7XF11_9HELO|nr:uncharacterized protein PAC_13495 [Phialocephala subalpina]
MSFNGTCNDTLIDLRIGASEVPVVGSLTFHSLALIIDLSCMSLGISLSTYLMFRHALNYTVPRVQKYLIRIIFMIPVYSLCTFLSAYFYWEAAYFQFISAAYASVAVTAYFSLLCQYVAPNLHENKNYFSRITPDPWGNHFPVPVAWFRACCCGEAGPWRTPRNGLIWFNILWIGVFQYSFFRVSMSIIAIITQYLGKYCQSSMSPLFTHIWVLVVDVFSAAIAMYCLTQFHWQMKDALAPHKAGLKLWCIKLVYAFSLYQNLILSAITSHWMPHPFAAKPTSILAYPDIKIGIPTLMLTFELFIMSIMHLFAFPWQPYDKSQPHTSENQGGALGWKAFADALNGWDLVTALWRTVMLIFRKKKYAEVGREGGSDEGGWGWWSRKRGVRGMTVGLERFDDEARLIAPFSGQR